MPWWCCWCHTHCPTTRRGQKDTTAPHLAGTWWTGTATALRCSCCTKGFVGHVCGNQFPTLTCGVATGPTLQSPAAGLSLIQEMLLRTCRARNDRVVGRESHRQLALLAFCNCPGMSCKQHHHVSSVSHACSCLGLPAEACCTRTVQLPVEAVCVDSVVVLLVLQCMATDPVQTFQNSWNSRPHGTSAIQAASVTCCRQAFQKCSTLCMV